MEKFINNPEGRMEKMSGTIQQATIIYHHHFRGRSTGVSRKTVPVKVLEDREFEVYAELLEEAVGYRKGHRMTIRRNMIK